MTDTPIHIVWFKRDLRIADHAPLFEAARCGRVLPLYIVEPDILRGEDVDAMHYRLVRDALESLRAALAELGQPLVVRVGAAVEVLRELCAAHTVAAVFAHEETGNALTYARDRAVADWARTAGVAFREWPQTGVVRRLGGRDGWSRIWAQRMHQPVIEPPSRLQAIGDLEPGGIPSAAALGLLDSHPAVELRRTTQTGGRDAALATIDSFLGGRGERYSQRMSSPLTAPEACSRLSPHLATGALSMRETVVRTEANRTLPARSRRAFLSRLHWHCHFMQKLETEPAIEFRCFNAAYEGLRDGDHASSRLDAWQRAQTGYPFVDACMRALQTTGWINFRMRAMLVSFAAYDLWLDWRLFRDFLARQFIDYEPGIHISQIQMQSGVTGINTPRIYNPVKQGWDHDPDGRFVRRWMPELAELPTPFVHEPWRASPLELAEAGVRIGVDYPAPVVDHAEAVREARRRIGEVRRSPEHRALAGDVFERHGSRKSRRDRMPEAAYRRRRSGGQDAPRFEQPAAGDDQLSLFESG